MFHFKECLEGNFTPNLKKIGESIKIYKKIDLKKNHKRESGRNLNCMKKFIETTEVLQEKDFQDLISKLKDIYWSNNNRKKSIYRKPVMELYFENLKNKQTMKKMEDFNNELEKRTDFKESIKI